MTPHQTALLLRVLRAVPVDNATLRVARNLQRRGLVEVSRPDRHGQRYTTLTPTGLELAQELEHATP